MTVRSYASFLDMPQTGVVLGGFQNFSPSAWLVDSLLPVGLLKITFVLFISVNNYLFVDPEKTLDVTGQ